MSDNIRSYESPFCTRYASEEMQYIFSADKKFTTWRKLWVALARAEMKLGLPVTEAQVKQLEEHINDIDYDMAAEREKVVRHDVMAHVYTYGQACPDAAGIIHLGATSCYVGDNTDVIIMRDALKIVRRKLINVMNNLAKFADEYKNMPCMAYTHLQPAQPTTVGKRATLWLNELLMDFEEIEHRIADLKLLGSKGTTGTQASFMELFERDTDKIKQLEKMIAEEMGFDKVVPVSGQTYSRKADWQVLSALSGIAQSCSKFSNDMRILQSFEEMEEPREKSQIGSSAMAYKRNPMRCERITSLARYVMIDVLNPAFTAGTQWFERTLDDSANKRISVAEAFLGRYPQYHDERYRRNGSIPRDSSPPTHGKAPLHGNREHHDGRCKEGRQPSGASRAYPHIFYAGSRADKDLRQGQQPLRTHRKRPDVHDNKGRTRRTAQA